MLGLSDEPTSKGGLWVAELNVPAPLAVMQWCASEPDSSRFPRVTNLKTQNSYGQTVVMREEQVNSPRSLLAVSRDGEHWVFTHIRVQPLGDADPRSAVPSVQRTLQGVAHLPHRFIRRFCTRLDGFECFLEGFRVHRLLTKHDVIPIAHTGTKINLPVTRRWVRRRGWLVRQPPSPLPAPRRVRRVSSRVPPVSQPPAIAPRLTYP